MKEKDGHNHKPSSNINEIKKLNEQIQKLLQQSVKQKGRALVESTESESSSEEEKDGEEEEETEEEEPVSSRKIQQRQGKLNTKGPPPRIKSTSKRAKSRRPNSRKSEEESASGEEEVAKAAKSKTAHASPGEKGGKEMGRSFENRRACVQDPNDPGGVPICKLDTPGSAPNRRRPAEKPKLKVLGRSFNQKDRDKENYRPPIYSKKVYPSPLRAEPEVPPASTRQKPPGTTRMGPKKQIGDGKPSEDIPEITCNSLSNLKKLISHKGKFIIKLTESVTKHLEEEGGAPGQVKQTKVPHIDCFSTTNSPLEDSASENSLENSRTSPAPPTPKEIPEGAEVTAGVAGGGNKPGAKDLFIGINKRGKIGMTQTQADVTAMKHPSKPVMRTGAIQTVSMASDKKPPATAPAPVKKESRATQKNLVLTVAASHTAMKGIVREPSKHVGGQPNNNSNLLAEIPMEGPKEGVKKRKSLGYTEAPSRGGKKLTNAKSHGQSPYLTTTKRSNPGANVGRSNVATPKRSRHIATVYNRNSEKRPILSFSKQVSEMVSPTAASKRKKNIPAAPSPSLSNSEDNLVGPEKKVGDSPKMKMATGGGGKGMKKPVQLPPVAVIKPAAGGTKSPPSANKFEAILHEEIGKIKENKVPIIWVFGYPQTSIVSNITRVLKALEESLQFHVINMENEIAIWLETPTHSENVKDLHEALVIEAKKLVSVVTKETFSGWSTLDLLHLFQLAMVSTNLLRPNNRPKGYILRSFPNTLEEGEAFERYFEYPADVGLYFLNEDWSSNKAKAPDIIKPKYFTRNETYAEGVVEAAAEYFGSKSFKITNAEALEGLKIHEVVRIVEERIFGGNNTPSCSEQQEPSATASSVDESNSNSKKPTNISLKDVPKNFA